MSGTQEPSINIGYLNYARGFRDFFSALILISSRHHVLGFFLPKLGSPNRKQLSSDQAL